MFFKIEFDLGQLLSDVNECCLERLLKRYIYFDSDLFGKTNSCVNKMAVEQCNRALIVDHQ